MRRSEIDLAAEEPGQFAIGAIDRRDHHAIMEGRPVATIIDDVGGTGVRLLIAARICSVVASSVSAPAKKRQLRPTISDSLYPVSAQKALLTTSNGLSGWRGLLSTMASGDKRSEATMLSWSELGSTGPW